ncbi:MAG: insulinase family protein [Planctomycetes bacterium]|nr:insulinase family protein [Planctomycetota bacterium]
MRMSIMRAPAQRRPFLWESPVRTNLIRAVLFTFVAAAVIACTLHSQEAPPKARALDVHEHVLENGLKLVVVNRPGVPLVSTFIWYKVGSMDEVPGQTGMAHFLEHMMFKGSRNYKVGEVDKVTVRNGGSNNAFTSNDYTGYFFDLPKSRYKEGLKIESDRMRHLTLDLAEFDAEKKVVQSESDISADDPSSQLWERMSGQLFGPAHPYSHPVLGWPQDVEDISRRDMRLFYDAHYHPNHATIVMVGDISSEEALASIKAHFGDIPRGPELQRPESAAINFKGPRTVEVRSEADLIEFGRQYLGVQAGHKDAAALDVLGMIMGNGVTSRFYRELVEKQRLATAVAAGNSDQILAGSFWTWAQLTPGVEREQFSAALEGVIKTVVDEGITADELTRTKNRFLSDLVFSQESASDLAQSLGNSETVYGGWRHALEYPDLIRAVTASDVQRVAGQYLKGERAVTGWLMPESAETSTVPRGEEPKPKALDVQRHVLSNGMTVLLLERPGLPVVSVQASVRAGRSGEAPSEHGLSSLTGSLLDAGTRDFSKQQIAETMQGIGANLSTSDGGVGVRVLAEHTDIGLNMLSQVLVHPTFPADEVELAKQQTLAGIEAARNETSWFARAAAAAALYGPANPLGRSGEGTPASVSAFKREDLQGWHQRYFRPDNCILAAVGDFESSEMLKRIEMQFKEWKRPQTPLEFPEFDLKRPDKLEGEQVFSIKNFDATRIDPKRKRILIDYPQKDQVVVRLQTLGITRDNPDYYALLVMDNILGTSPGFTDRFSGKLRDELGLAYSTYANITGGSGIYKGAFLGYIGTRAENVELALATMYELIEQIRTESVSDQELIDAKDYLKGSFVFGIETTGQLAGMLIEMQRYNLGFDYLVKYANAVDDVTKEDIQRVASKYLVPEQMVEVLAGPVTKITPLPEAPEGE